MPCPSRRRSRQEARNKRSPTAPAEREEGPRRWRRGPCTIHAGDWCPVRQAASAAGSRTGSLVRATHPRRPGRTTGTGLGVAAAALLRPAGRGAWPVNLPHSPEDAVARSLHGAPPGTARRCPRPLRARRRRSAHGRIPRRFPVALAGSAGPPCPSPDGPRFRCLAPYLSPPRGAVNVVKSVTDHPEPDLASSTANRSCVSLNGPMWNRSTTPSGPMKIVVGSKATPKARATGPSPGCSVSSSRPIG